MLCCIRNSDPFVWSLIWNSFVLGCRCSEKAENPCFNKFWYLIKKNSLSNFPFVHQDDADNVSFDAVHIGNSVDKLVINYMTLIKGCTTERKHLSMNIHIHPYSQAIRELFRFCLLKFLHFVPLCIQSFLITHREKKLTSLSRSFHTIM